MAAGAAVAVTRARESTLEREVRSAIWRWGPESRGVKNIGAALGLVLVFCGPFLIAQTARPITIQVTETTGIRRTEYPTNARVSLPRSALANADQARLRLNGADVPAQFTAADKWDNGSVKTLEVDFNVSLGPGDSRTYQLEYGSGITSGAPPRGLLVTEAPNAIQVGNVKFNKSGSPLIASANYRSEYIGSGANGLGVIDAAGARHDLSTAQGLKVELLKRGPLVATIRYTGRLPIAAGYDVPFTITCEMPNSKSWVRTTADVTDSAKRVKGLTFSTPVSLGDKPWIWDFGTTNGTYGAMRNATDMAVLTQTVGAKAASSWTVQTSAQGTLVPYEQSTMARSAAAYGWGHIYDSSKAIAFAVDKFATEPGTYTLSLSGEGQAVFSITPAGPRTDHQIVVYEHFVSTPVPIGAATSPTAMLNRLAVAVKNP